MSPEVVPVYVDDRVTLYHGDCREIMSALPDCSIDAIVTDPPYGLEFMGKDWDAPWKGKASTEFNQLKKGSLGGFTQLPNHSRVNNLKCKNCGKWKFSSNPCICDKPQFPNARLASMNVFQDWFTEVACECLRVLKPGGHLLAFGGTRTWHRLAVAIEDAGFEVRDSIAWMYGSGFPKSLDVSKAIDKAAGVEREVVGQYSQTFRAADSGIDGWQRPSHSVVGVITAPATHAAQQWQGWGTALKPAFEPIVVARKPLDGTVAENVLRWGTGALNIDGSRIAGQVPSVPQPQFGVTHGVTDFGAGEGRNGEMSSAPQGRWPANVILDESQAAELDKQSGVSISPNTYVRNVGTLEGERVAYTNIGEAAGTESLNYGDTGGASRFFYVPKAGKRERPNVDGVSHPTVKPLQLMRYLINLVTPPDGVVLDPFSGSGATIEAAILEQKQSIGIELTDEYLPLIRERIARQTDGKLL